MRSRTPKLRKAEPKNTGVRWPSRNAALSNGLQASAASSISESAASASCAGSRAATRGSRGPSTASASPSASILRTEIATQIERAGKIAAPSDGPGDRRGVERQHRLDLVEQFERVARLAVHLVDEGDDGNVAQAADLEQFTRARLDALGRVDHHHGGIHRRQRAIGVFREVLVARRVEQVVDAIAIFECHHRSDDGNAALALDAHPVRAGLATVGLGAHLAGEIGWRRRTAAAFRSASSCPRRVRNDGEGAPAGDLILKRHCGNRMGCGPEAPALGPHLPRRAAAAQWRVGAPFPLPLARPKSGA
jgi:hypothetical protein